MRRDGKHKRTVHTPRRRNHLRWSGLQEEKAAPVSEGGVLRCVPWPCVCLASLQQFNRKAFHAAGHESYALLV